MKVIPNLNKIFLCFYTWTCLLYRNQLLKICSAHGQMFHHSRQSRYKTTIQVFMWDNSHISHEIADKSKCPKLGWNGRRLSSSVSQFLIFPRGSWSCPRLDMRSLQLIVVLPWGLQTSKGRLVRTPRPLSQAERDLPEEESHFRHLGSWPYSFSYSWLFLV